MSEKLDQPQPEKSPKPEVRPTPESRERMATAAKSEINRQFSTTEKKLAKTSFWSRVMGWGASIGRGLGRGIWGTAKFFGRNWKKIAIGGTVAAATLYGLDMAGFGIGLFLKKIFMPQKAEWDMLYGVVKKYDRAHPEDRHVEHDFVEHPEEYFGTWREERQHEINDIVRNEFGGERHQDPGPLELLLQWLTIDYGYPGTLAD
jgi:hypothetical protein